MPCCRVAAQKGSRGSRLSWMHGWHVPKNFKGAHARPSILAMQCAKTMRGLKTGLSQLKQETLPPSEASSLHTHCSQCIAICVPPAESSQQSSARAKRACKTQRNQPNTAATVRERTTLGRRPVGVLKTQPHATVKPMSGGLATIVVAAQRHLPCRAKHRCCTSCHASSGRPYKADSCALCGNTLTRAHPHSSGSHQAADARCLHAQQPRA